MARSGTKVAVASTALQMIGSAPIASFDDNDAGAVVANNIFDDIAEEALGGHPWTFAKKMSDALSRLSAAPEGKWDAVYQLPSDVLEVRTILINDLPVDYEIFGDQAYMNAETTAEPIAIYTHYVPVNVWSPLFRLYMQFNLASIFALSVAMKPEISEAFELKADRQLRKAKTKDSQSETSKNVRTSRFLANRR